MDRTASNTSGGIMGIPEKPNHPPRPAAGRGDCGETRRDGECEPAVERAAQAGNGRSRSGTRRSQPDAGGAGGNSFGAGGGESVAHRPAAEGRGSGCGAAESGGQPPSSADVQRASIWFDDREDSAINTLAALAADNPELQAEIEEMCRRYSYEMSALEETPPNGYDLPTPILPPAEDAGRYRERPDDTPVVIAPKRRK